MERRKLVQLAGGAAVAWPLAALAQQTTRGIPLVAVLFPTTEDRAVKMTAALRDGLKQAGVVEGVTGEVFNLASGRETKVIELARQVNEITDNKAGIIHAERRNWDTHNRRWASIDKARRFLGYEPIIDLRSGLQHTVDWFRMNWTSILSGAQF